MQPRRVSVGQGAPGARVRGLPGCSSGSSTLLLKGLRQERLLFYSYVDKHHNDENAKDGQLQAPRKAVAKVLDQEAALQALVLSAVVLFGGTPMTDSRNRSCSIPVETFQRRLGM